MMMPATSPVTTENDIPSQEYGEMEHELSLEEVREDEERAADDEEEEEEI